MRKKNKKMLFMTYENEEPPITFKVIEWDKKWNDKNNCFYKHTWVVICETMVLCQGVKQFPYWRWHPIVWNNYKAAEDWVKTGTIGEIQESMTNLHIGFQKNFIEMIDHDDWHL